MFKVLAFMPDKVQASRGSHTVVVTDQDSGIAQVIVRKSGSLTEVLTPDHPEFATVLQMLSAVTGVEVSAPSEVRVEKARR